MRLLIVASALEALNKNIKSCRMYLSELIRYMTKKRLNMDENEMILNSFANTFIKNETGDRICEFASEFKNLSMVLGQYESKIIIFYLL